MITLLHPRADERDSANTAGPRLQAGASHWPAIVCTCTKIKWWSSLPRAIWSATGTCHFDGCRQWRFAQGQGPPPIHRTSVESPRQCKRDSRCVARAAHHVVSISKDRSTVGRQCCATTAGYIAPLIVPLSGPALTLRISGRHERDERLGMWDSTTSACLRQVARRQNRG
jgi:hypothetical protein